MGVKRLVAIAISVAALVAPVGLWAQRGGGGRSVGGGHSFGGGRSFSGGHAAGGFSGFHSSPAPVSRPSPGWSGFNSARQSSGNWRGFGGRRGPLGGGQYPGRGFRNRYYGYGFGPYAYDPYWYGYGFYPYGSYIPSSLSYAGFPDDYQSSDQGAQAPPEDYGAAPTEAENELEGQVQQLGDEVEQLRAGQGYPPGPGYPGPGYGPGYGGQGYGAPPRGAAAPSTSESQLPTVLVYRDGRQIEVQNYAIYGQKIWVFGNQITRKIALSDLDVAKTKQLNGQRGVDFDIPESN
jgi:hypothetical protein